MILVLCLWLILLLGGTPLYISLGIASIMYIFSQGLQPLIIPQKVAMAADSFPLLAAPFFILMGNIMNHSGVTQRIFRFSTTLVGWIRGGLGHANIIASLIFAGMSGAAVADAGGLGTIEIEAMRNAGYDDDFSCAITAASSTVGPIIPPSLPMVILGVSASTSIGGLFIGGILPGLLMAGSLMLLVHFLAKKRGYPKGKFPSVRGVWQSFLSAFWALLAPLILLFGILSGMFTPTEAAVVAALYALILGIFVYKEFRISDLPQMIITTVETSGVVMALVMTAVLFGWNLTVGQLPQRLGKMLMGLSDNPIVILLIINLFLLFVGCFMEAIAAMIILIPVFLPVIDALGINHIQFGLIMILNLMIGTITPPVGVVLGVTANIAHVPFERVTRATLPFLLPLLIVLLLITVIPELTTFLPNVLMGIK
ncbi:ABC transporter permease [candidate division KSB3 bacterium]|uniref:ABC transporter permease n=1 Tax=candidate division KSB3 bacterium TaxID=2044937 RepID=A0A2G6E5W7_9BACT|nr:MAG: ABC transporter permease [candidate division KSB3 bacterium]PIE29821.1 MAG: ABC transporter permease [candidate division KSB3 bacterium]